MGKVKVKAKGGKGGKKKLLTSVKVKLRARPHINKDGNKRT